MSKLAEDVMVGNFCASLYRLGLYELGNGLALYLNGVWK